MQRVELIQHEYQSELIEHFAWDIFALDRYAAGLGGFCVTCVACECASIVSHKDFGEPRLFDCPHCNGDPVAINTGLLEAPLLKYGSERDRQKS